MKFREITKESKVFPGEYLLHEPTKNIVLVGAYNWDEGFIRVMANGRLLEDKISHFKKIVLTHKERRKTMRRGCGGCKGR
tara:strand:- start:5005 stop:5244 length:240 start_codon:yes stop_codon:yes gene_type:complete